LYSLGRTPGRTLIVTDDRSSRVSHSRPAGALSRRQALALSGATAGGLLAARAGIAPGLAESKTALLRKHGRLPVQVMQKIIGAEGSTSKSVLGISVSRDDIGTVTGPGGVPIKAPFQLNHDFFFQPLGDKLAFFNGDVCLKPSEVDPVIDALFESNLVFQALHQHFYDFDPPVWFIHFRGLGDPSKLAKAVRHVLDATATPLPQTKPTNPTTPLDVHRLVKTLGGEAEVESNGVVTVDVGRADKITIADVDVAPETNISTNIQFQSLDGTDTNVAVAPDMSMTSAEIQPVIRLLRKYGFDVGCLYNQETNEHPQLYFSHAFKVGNPYTIAAEVRHALDHTKSD
jgi:hypothetical protein